MSLALTGQSWARRLCVSPRVESTLWKERRGTLTHVHSAPATAAACCARPRCVLLCSARAQSEHRTPAAHTAQVRFSTTPAPVLSYFIIKASRILYQCPASCIFERTEVNITFLSSQTATYPFKLFFWQLQWCHTVSHGLKKRLWKRWVCIMHKRST